jgi:hypothetical protein
MEDKELKAKIKEMEAKNREEVVLDTEAKVSFDQWWVMLAKRITVRPSLKEILWADFSARGVGKEELSSKYDECLKLFGL